MVVVRAGVTVPIKKGMDVARRYTDKEIEEMTSEQFERLQRGEDPYTDATPPASAAPAPAKPMTGEEAIRKRKRALRDVMRATR